MPNPNEPDQSDSDVQPDGMYWIRGRGGYTEGGTWRGGRRVVLTTLSPEERDRWMFQVEKQ